MVVLLKLKIQVKEEGRSEWYSISIYADGGNFVGGNTGKIGVSDIFLVKYNQLINIELHHLIKIHLTNQITNS